MYIHTYIHAYMFGSPLGEKCQILLPSENAQSIRKFLLISGGKAFC